MATRSHNKPEDIAHIALCFGPDFSQTQDLCQVGLLAREFLGTPTRRFLMPTSMWMLSIFIVILFTTSALAQSSPYSVLEMSGLRGGNSFATDVNMTGEVVGRSGRLHGTETHAFIWTSARNTEALQLGAVSKNTRATAISNQGLVVGFGETSDSMHAFLWSQKDGYEDLGTLPGDSSSKAQAINDVGQVVGSSSGPRGQHAVLWKKGLGFLDLGTLPGGQISEARGINNLGEVVGNSDSSGGSHAFLWTPDLGLEDLGTLPNDRTSVAYAINDAGQVVGSSFGASGVRAFLWTRSAGMRDIGGLAGASYTEAYSINTVGQVVGISGTSQSGTRAFIWTPKTGTRDLNDLVPKDFELRLSGALHINDRSWIVVFGNTRRELISDRSLEHGQHTSPNRIFLLTPNSTP